MKNNFVLVFAALALLVTLSACKDVAIQDGKIPQAYLQDAKGLAGTYSGSISTSGPQAQGGTQNAVLKIQFVNQRPVLTTSVDFAGAGCGSRIGQLQRVSVDGNGNLSRATFGFSGGRCAADNHIVLNFFSRTSDGKVKISAFLIQNVVSHNGDTQNPKSDITERIGRFTSN